MPVKKTAAKKTVAKKTVAKSAAPALAKKVASAKTATKKAPAKVVDPIKGFADNIAAAITAGEFDGHLGVLDDALTERSNRQVAEKRAAAPAKKVAAKPEKKVAAPPKRVASVTPETGVTYVVSKVVKSIEGAKVKFLRVSAKDEAKCVVEMLTDKPGSPKGKKVGIPIIALEADTAPAKKKRAVKK